MRKKDETLRETLLDCAREVANAEGPEAINIRIIAKQAGVATGTVYNYFSNKDDILLALTEEYWRKTLTEMWDDIKSDSFCGQLKEMYAFLSRRIQSSAGLLMHSLSNIEATGRDRMNTMQEVLGADIIQRMNQDVNIRGDIWNETFTKERFAQFIIMNMMLLLQIKAPTINFFIEIVKRTIY